MHPDEPIVPTLNTCRCRSRPTRSISFETFSDTRVIGLTINHENMTDADVSAAIARYQDELGIPVTDPLTRPPRILVEMVLSAFPRTLRKPPAVMP